MGCFGLSLVQLKLKQLDKQLRSCGLERKLVNLAGGESCIECWIPSEVSPDKPCLLLVHGFALNALLEWEFQVKDFSREFNLFVPNLIFFGESTTSSKNRSEVFQAECLKAMLEELGVAKVDVVGTSYGGMVAFWMAHFFPDLVARLVLVDSAVTADLSEIDKGLARHGLGRSELLMPTTAAAARKSMEFALQKKQPLIPSFVLQDMVQEVFCHNRELREELLEGMVIGYKQSCELLPKLSQKVFIVWGENDRLFELELAHDLNKHLDSSAKLLIIARAAHTPHADQPKAFNGPVLHYLRNGP